MTCASARGVTSLPDGVQGPRRRAAARRVHVAPVLGLVLLALAGCAATGGGPVDWWHQLQGGRIAEERPPPPRADAPYPNLASVPARPAVDDAAQRGRIAAGLVADRANAQYGTAPPLPAVPPMAPRPAAPPPAAGEMGAQLAAASRQAPPPQPPLPSASPSTSPPRTAPVGRVAAAPLAPPPAQEAEAAPPDIPAAPPPPPALDGVRQATAPSPPPVAPPPAAPVAQPLPPGAPVAVAFADGSASLPEGARVQLRTLAERRGGRTIQVAGFGSAAEGDTAGQSRALPLAWERAGAIAGALQAAGVPANALSISARATGQGGLARIAE